MKRILLTGYYGFGNLGDDLLFICNYRLLQKIYKDCQIDVFTESPAPSYLNRFAGKPLTFLNGRSSGDYDIIWHGGGGVYFDFNKGDAMSLLTNRMIRVLGPRNFTLLYQFGKRTAGKPVISYKRRIGMGIGVGSFTRSSKKYKHKIQQLCTFDHLVVRDEESKKNALTLCDALQVDVATDIVFDKDLWNGSIDEGNREPKTQKRIGVILRDWGSAKAYNYLEDVYNQLQWFVQQGYETNCFAFDANADKNYIDHFTRRGKAVNVWDPARVTLNDYLESLSQQDVFITSRFHGAVIGVCLGISGICLNIEPKLETASAMTENFYTVQNLPIQPANLQELLRQAIFKTADAQRFGNNILAGNRQKLENAYKRISTAQ